MAIDPNFLLSMVLTIKRDSLAEPYVVLRAVKFKWMFLYLFFAGRQL